MNTRLPMLAFLIAAPLAACATAPAPPPVAMAAAPAPAAHVCPKHPEAVSDKQAACPKCGMKMMANQPPSQPPTPPPRDQPTQPPAPHDNSHH